MLHATLSVLAALLFLAAGYSGYSGLMARVSGERARAVILTSEVVAPSGLTVSFASGSEKTPSIWPGYAVRVRVRMLGDVPSALETELTLRPLLPILAEAQNMTATLRPGTEVDIYRDREHPSRSILATDSWLHAAVWPVFFCVLAVGVLATSLRYAPPALQPWTDDSGGLPAHSSESHALPEALQHRS